METKLINGKEIAGNILKETSEKVNLIKKKYDKSPGLAVIYIGNDKASQVYADTIIKKCTNTGFKGKKYVFSRDVDEGKILEVINQLNNDNEINGVIIQFPLPKGLNEENIKLALSPEKDVDCINPISVGKLYSDVQGFIPCTPKGAIRLLKSIGIGLTGKNALVIGRSNIVGRPVAELLLKENLSITVCHSKTQNLDEHIAKADVVVAAVGKPQLVKGDALKSGAIVIDVGTNVVDGKLVGDVDFNTAIGKAAFITPVPGGVGPMTIAMLLENTLEACIKQWDLEL